MKNLCLSATILFALTAAAGAADLPMRPAPAPIAVAPLFTWTGFYVGVNAGYGWSSNSNNNTVINPATGVFLSGGGGNNGGFVGGGQIGYNYQIGSFVIGAETDIQYADVNHDRTFGGSSSHNGYFGTVRARAGYAFDRTLIYATGGFAYGGISSDNFGNADSNGGWTLGGGAEYAFTNNLTAKVEGLYVKLERNKNNYLAAAVPGVNYAIDNRNDGFGVIRAGLNYKFNSY
jgi:outer membrane immunogenic protein